jgi:hypothetical protein
MFHRKLSFIIEMIREEDEEGVEHLRCVAGWKEIPRSSLLNASCGTHPCMAEMTNAFLQADTSLYPGYMQMYCTVQVKLSSSEPRQ